VAAQVMAALRALADDGAAVLLVEHDTASALAVADHGVVLVRGEVALAGDPASLTPELLARTYLG
jgi:ABC-type branched-subunit amino acid transport system ATPase component